MKVLDIKFGRVTLWCAILFVIWIAPCGQAQAPSPIAFVLEKSVVTVGEPVLLDVNVRNTASQPLEVDFGLGAEDNILISVTDPEGKPHEKPEAGMREGLQFFGWMRLASGQDYSATLILNKWFQFNEAGRYQVAIHLTKPAKVGDIVLPSDAPVLTLDVGPYDPQRLASVCSELAAKIRRRETADEYTAAGIAEHALAYVHDPVAVPYWGQVLEYADGMAISSLRKIGSRDAVHVLTRALDLPDKETRAQARFALESIARETFDPAVREQAQLALRRP